MIEAGEGGEAGAVTPTLADLPGAADEENGTGVEVATIRQDDPPAVGPSASWSAGSAAAISPASAGPADANAAQAQPPYRGAGHVPRPGGNGSAPIGRGNAVRPAPVARSERAAGVPSCTSPQLRRFIKSRAYVPMHELRRRFAIEGEDDDVTAVDVSTGRIYVGLPSVEGRLLGDLLREGEIGFELSVDPVTPIVVGVYAMRPVPRT